MHDPGLDRHEWESEMQALEEQLGESPGDALPELDELVGRMLEETGWNRKESARRLRISYKALRNKLKKWQLTRQKTQPEEVKTLVKSA